MNEVNIQSWTTQAQAQLAELYDNREALNLINKLIESYLQLPPHERILQSKRVLTQDEHLQLDSAIQRLLAAEPIQYILGYEYFLNLKFSVNQSVLIPRPETEELVLNAIKLLETNKSPKILDACTGSGCIAIALSHKLPLAEVYACDISTEALKIAESNSKNTSTNVHFFLFDVVMGSPSDLANICAELDLVVSNPPYIPLNEQGSLHPNVAKYEPHIALFVPEQDPLIFYKALGLAALQILKSGGWLAVEVHTTYAMQVKLLFESQKFAKTIIIQDLHQRSRFVFAQK